MDTFSRTRMRGTKNEGLMCLHVQGYSKYYTSIFVKLFHFSKIMEILLISFSHMLQMFLFRPKFFFPKKFALEASQTTSSFVKKLEYKSKRIFLFFGPFHFPLFFFYASFFNSLPILHLLLVILSFFLDKVYLSTPLLANYK